MKTIVKEPLLHFLALGVALFVAYSVANPEQADQDPSTIVVDRDRLLTYLQYRSRTFDQQRFGDLLDTLDDTELEQLIDSYVREEALYREAKALALDQNDYVARLRLIQQLEFITRGFAEAEIDLTEVEIERYYETHKADYREPPTVTFTHVFFNQEQHGIEQTEALAREALEKLNRDQVPFEGAPGHGDGFLYHLNYVAREPDEVASHFGATMQERLFALAPSKSTWRGPFQSPYGIHLVLLTAREASYIPPLEAIRARVQEDLRRTLLEERFEQSVQVIVGGYEVDVRSDIQKHLGS